VEYWQSPSNMYGKLFHGGISAGRIYVVGGRARKDSLRRVTLYFEGKNDA